MAGESEPETGRPFAEARRLLLEYIELRQSRDSTFPVDLLAEARIRLEQLDYVLERARELAAPPLALDEVHDRLAVVFVYVDSFYQIVTRLKTLFHKNKVLGLRAFEPKASLEIRGKLIQHPEGPDGVHVLWWTIRHDDGRGPTYNTNDQFDQGLFVNADAVRLDLERTIREAIGGA